MIYSFNKRKLNINYQNFYFSQNPFKLVNRFLFIKKVQDFLKYNSFVTSTEI